MVRQAQEEAAADEEQPSAELKYLPGCFVFCFFSLSHLNMTHGTLHEIHPYDFVFARDKLLSLHHQLVVIIIRPNAPSFTLKCTVWSWAIATATTNTWQRRRRRSSTWGLWLAVLGNCAKQKSIVAELTTPLPPALTTSLPADDELVRYAC